MTYWPLEDAPGERPVHPVADLGDWVPSYGPEDRAESALDDHEAASLQFREAAATFLVPPALLEDYGDAGWLGDWLGKALRGEIEPKPPREPKRHRCLACWLVSKLPGHDRCSHGYLESGCETCGGW
jgi:hypothetical protein